MFNVNRAKNKRFMPPAEFMLLSKERGSGASSAAQPMRIAAPGERPPSRRKSGEKDTTIERFDAYVAATRGKKYG